MKRLLKISPYLVLLIGFVLRLYRLGANSLWYDETVSVVLAQSELAELLRHTAGDIHPPLYYVLLHFWGRVAGWSEFAMAFVSLWFGVLLIAVVWRVMRAWTSPQPSPLQGEGVRPSPQPSPLEGERVRPSRQPSPLQGERVQPSPQPSPLQGERVRPSPQPSPLQGEGVHPSSQPSLLQGEGVVALVAALFVAISPYNIWYSQEVRMYTLGATLGLLSVYFLRRMLAQKKFFSRDFLAYVIFTVLGFYTLYYFIFLMVFQYVYVAYRAWQNANSSPSAASRSLLADNRPLLTFSVSQLALLFLYLPWLGIAFRQATEPPVPPWREFIALPRVLLETFSALAFGQAVDWNVFGLLALLLFIPIGALLGREWQNRKSKTGGEQRRTIEIRNSVSAMFLLGYFLIPLASIYALSLWKPLYHVRYMFTYSPAFYMLAAYALVNLANEFQKARRKHAARWLYPLGALAIAVSSGFFLGAGFSLYNFWHSPQYVEDDLRGAAHYIAERWRPGDVIIVNAGYAYPALVYYFPEPLTRERLTAPPTNQRADEPTVLMTGSLDGAPNLGWGDPRSDFYATNADETRAALDHVFQNYARVWMLRIYDTVVDPQGIVRAYFGERATLFDEQPFSGEAQTRVLGYLTAPTRELPPNATRLNQNLGERVELVGYAAGAREIERGKFFDAALYWRLRQTVNYNYQVSLQLLNAQGENVAQHDEMPLSEMLPMTRWNTDTVYREPLRVKIPLTLAPGEYRAIAKLYEPRSGEVVGDIIELGTVHVR